MFSVIFELFDILQRICSFWGMNELFLFFVLKLIEISRGFVRLLEVEIL